MHVIQRYRLLLGEQRRCNEQRNQRRTQQFFVKSACLCLLFVIKNIRQIDFGMKIA